MSILVCQRERAVCFALFVFLVYRDYCAALPCGFMGLSAVCDCGISRSYSLTIFVLRPGPEVIKYFSCSAQLRIEFLIKCKMAEKTFFLTLI